MASSVVAAVGTGAGPFDPALPAMGSYDFDDDLAAAARATNQPRHRVYRLDDTVVVLGRGSNPRRELHLEACRADGISLLRRRGGGCSVVIDPGNVIVSAALPRGPLLDLPRAIASLSAWLIAGLERVGVVGVSREGVSDLVWRGRKISGSCMHVSRDLVAFSATLLVDADLELISRYLAHPPREPAYRSGRDHRAFIGCVTVKGLEQASAFAGALSEALESPTLTR